MRRSETFFGLLGRRHLLSNSISISRRNITGPTLPVLFGEEKTTKAVGIFADK
jgi:hypothetical protein